MPVATEGHLHLGLPSENAPGTTLLRLVADFRREYPRVRCSLAFGSLPTIQEELIAERLSFALVDQSSDHDFIEAVTVGERRDVLVATRRYVEEHGPFASTQALGLADVILTAGEEVWPGLAVTPEAAAVVPCHAAALTLAAAGGGVALVPAELAAEHVAAGTVVTLTPGGFAPPPRPRHLLYRKRSARQLFESLFLEFFLDAAGVTPPPSHGVGRRQAS